MYHFLSGIDDVKKQPSIIPACVYNRVIEEANQLCSHTFYLLGCEYTFIDTINWHMDFRSGVEFPRLPSTELWHYVGSSLHVDIKVPWELSRCQHFARLGQAYVLSGEEKYAEEIVSQIEHWIQANPYGIGVHWMCTMEVAIRAANWILGCFFLREYVTDSFIDTLNMALYQHGWHIYHHLENQKDFTSNHYIANLAGLLYIAIFLSKETNTDLWYRFAMQELQQEMFVQVYPDGSDYEASTSYHRFVLEMFFYSAYICRLKKKPFSEAFVARLHKMFVCALYLMKSNGRIAQIGDNDNAQFFKFSQHEVLDHSYLMSIGAIFFQDAQFKQRKFLFSMDAFWLFGIEGWRYWDRLPYIQKPLSGIALSDAGWYIMRDENVYLCISCGPNGLKGHGCHAHNDKLSYDLAINGMDVIVDPGSYTYTSNPDIRQKLRSTRYHNTLFVDEHEQNVISCDDVFRMANDAHARCLHWSVTPEKDVFIGEHYGFQEKCGIVHRRSIVFFKPEKFICIEDEVFHETNTFHGCYNNLNIPSLKHIHLDHLRIMFNNVTLIFSGEYKIDKGYYSSGYGHIMGIDRIIYQGMRLVIRF
jgi:uncharacterized heparinase superfamily protein